MSEGKAIFRLEADPTNYNAGIDSATKKTQQFAKAAEKAGTDAASGISKAGAAAEAESLRTEKRQERLRKSLELELATLKGGVVGRAEFRAQQAGIDPAEIAKISAAFKEATAANQKFGQSVRATGYAMSLIPAQMTDIVTQLAGGQSPFLILTQQGGQLKDMFGGVGPAVKAVGGYLAGLVNPLTVAAAAFAALGFAYIKGASEAEAFNKALILTGNSAGVTARQLGDMAANISGSIGTVGRAAEALVALTNGGRFTADQLESVGKSVVRFAEATGQSVQDTVKEFASLTDDPLKGIEKLNEKYNFLTAATYQQIKALQDQGETQKAVTLALNTFSTETDRMSKEVVANLGFVERAWKGIKDEVGKATDAVFSFGRAATTKELNAQLDEVNTKLRKYTELEAASGALTVPLRRQQMALDKQRLDILAQLSLQQQTGFDAANKAGEQQYENEKIAAGKSLATLLESARTKEQLRTDEIAKVKRSFDKLYITEAEYLKAVAAINEKYKDPAVTDNAAARMLQQLREQEASTRAQLTTTDKLVTSEKKLAEFAQLISDLKSKSTLTEDQKSLIFKQDEIKAQLEINAGLENELKLKEEIQKINDRAKEVSTSLAMSEQSRGEQYTNQLQAVSMGKQAFERAREEANIRKEYQKSQVQLAKDLSAGALNTTEFEDAQKRINDLLEISLGNFRQYYENLDTLNSDWSQGVKGALQDYVASARNSAQLFGDAMTRALGGVEDAFVQFVSTGKLSFSDLANSIISDLARILARQTIVAPIAGALSSVLGSAFSSVPDTASWALPEITGARAAGGSVGASGFYQVNESGPELFSTGGKTYLMSGASGGYVTPLTTGQGGSGAGGNVNINVVNEAGGDGYQATASARKNEGGFDVDILVRKAVSADLRNNGPMAQQMSNTFGLRRTM